jgi:anti-anti-sigma factor
MTITDTREQGAVIVAPVGRIDSTTFSALEQHLAGLASAGEYRTVIDFSGVDYISSAGLRVMLALAKRTKDRKGRVALCAMNDSVRQVFQLAGFLALFDVQSLRADAVRRVVL